jgi:hypothetical protein
MRANARHSALGLEQDPQLLVNDNAAGDVGKIDIWSVNF